MTDTTQKQTLNLSTWYKGANGNLLILLLSCTLLSFFFFFCSQKIYYDSEEVIQKAEKEFSSLQETHTALKFHEEAMLNAPHKLLRFQKNGLIQSLTIETLKKRLQTWQKHLQIQTLNTQFGIAKIESKELALWRIPISIDMKTLKDKQFFQFLEKIHHDLPGLTQLRSFHLKRTTTLSSELLKQIILGKKINLFEGKIEFDWVYRSEPKLQKEK